METFYIKPKDSICIPLKRFLDDIYILGEYKVIVYDSDEGDYVDVPVDGNEHETINCISAVQDTVVIELVKSTALEKQKEERRQRQKMYRNKKTGYV